MNNSPSPLLAADTPAPSSASSVYAKYGEAGLAGFQVVPDLLLKHQADLGLSPTDLTVLLNILMHWWYPGQKPFPRATSISRRMNVSLRTVQRSMQHLEHLALLKREKAERAGKVVTYLDPEPLVRRLEGFAARDADYQYRRQRRLQNGEGELGPNQLPLKVSA